MVVLNILFPMGGELGATASWGNPNVAVQLQEAVKRSPLMTVGWNRGLERGVMDS